MSRAPRRNPDVPPAAPAPAPLLLVLLDAYVLAALSVVVVTAGRWPLPLVAVLLSGTLAYLVGARLYASRLTLSVLDDLPSMVLAVALGTALAAVSPWGPPGSGGLSYLGAASALLGGLVLSRTLGYAGVHRARRTGRARHRAVVVGSGSLVERLVMTLQDHPECGLDVVGVLRPGGDGEVMGHRHLGDHRDLPQVTAGLRASQVLVAWEGEEPDDLAPTLRACQRRGVTVFTVPGLHDLATAGSRSTDQAWGIPLARCTGPRMRGAALATKRAVDVTVAAVALAAIWPVLAVVAAAVRLEGGPGVLFRQERVGQDGRLFTIYKFRSLRPVDDTEQATHWSVGGDSRLGPVGRFIRKTSLDELPQLFNVLSGQMSLVGPRPERPFFVEEFSSTVPRYAERHRAPVGLTGWAQVNGLRGDTSIVERARFDNDYIDGWSLWLDVKILLRTTTRFVGGDPSKPVPPSQAVHTASTVRGAEASQPDQNRTDLVGADR